MNIPYTNSGHGHVWQRPDGVKARCGGVILCKECQADQGALNNKELNTTHNQSFKDEELYQLLYKFGEQFETPYAYMTDNDRSPASQQDDARIRLIHETMSQLKALIQTEKKSELTQPDLGRVVGYLLGENDLDGLWFGEKPVGQQTFWWRRKLREALKQTKEVTK